MNAFVIRHGIGEGVRDDGGWLVLSRDGRDPVDLGPWDAGDWWARVEELAPITWYVNEMVVPGHWREGMIPASVVSLSCEVAAAWPGAEIALCKETRAVRSAVGGGRGRCNCLA